MGRGLELSSSLKPNNCGSLNFPLSLCCWQWGWDHGSVCVICLECSHLKVHVLDCSFLNLWLERSGLLFLLLLFPFSEGLVLLWFALSAVVGTYRLSASLDTNLRGKNKAKVSSLCYFSNFKVPKVSFPSYLHLFLLLFLFFFLSPSFSLTFVLDIMPKMFSST